VRSVAFLVAAHGRRGLSSVAGAASGARRPIATRDLEWDPVDPASDAEPASLLVPARALWESMRTLSGTRVEIAGGAGQAVFGLATDNQRHPMRTLDLAFAPYQRYLDSPRTATARLDTAAFTEALERVALLSAHGPRVRLTFAASSVRMCAGADDEARAQETGNRTPSVDPVRPMC
jgi:DNA polymerase-3 subunit beta